MRHGLVQLTLDVPDDDQLLDWAHTPYKPLAGRVIFYDAKGGPALETLAWEEGQCIGYQEEFASGDTSMGAYVCHLTIAAPKLTLLPGGPAPYVAAAAGEHGKPALASAPLVAAEAEAVATVPELVAEPTLAELLASAGSALAEGLTALAAVAAVPVVLTLGLILGSSTPAGGPGIPQPHGLPIDPDLLRLNTLAARHAAGTLTANEEAELIDLLAKVKGIHIQSLNDLNVQAPLRGNPIALPGFYNISLPYTKRPEADLVALRNKFNSSARKNFLKKIETDPSTTFQLKQAGFSDEDIEDIADGIQPVDYQVHHKLPLDDGGDNSFDNLVLIKNEPYHKSLTNL